MLGKECQNKNKDLILLSKISGLLKIFLVAIVFAVPIEASAQEPVEKKPEKNWKGNVEAGTTIVNGNTKQESLFNKSDIRYKKGNWGDKFKTRMENTKTNNVRVRERYDVNNSLRYDYDEMHFSFVELEYIDDRYGGYDYRISESVGYGYHFIKSDEMMLSSQFSAGSRQVKFTNADKEDSWLVRVGGDFEWKINKDIEFKQHLDLSFDRETEITRSDTSLKIKMRSISDSLYFSLSYFLERKSNTVSPDVKNTDSTLMMMFGYSF